MWPIYMKSSLRKAIMTDYVDLDIVNAHVNFTYLLCCCVLPNSSFPYLECYAAHREYVLNYIQLNANVTREKAKHSMLLAMFGGSGEVKDPFLEGFKKDLYRVAKALKTRIKAYDHIGRLLRRVFPDMPSDSKEEISNPTAKDLSYITTAVWRVP